MKYINENSGMMCLCYPIAIERCDKDNLLRKLLLNWVFSGAQIIEKIS